MAPTISESENYKTVFAIISQVDLAKAGIDWKKVATDLGLTSADGARLRWKKILAMGSAGAAAPARKANGGAKRSRKPKAAPKRKASDAEDDGEGDTKAEDDDTASPEMVGDGKAKQKRGRPAKKVKTEVEHEEFENGNGAEEYYQNAQDMVGGNDVEQWLNNNQVAQGEDEDEYAIQDYEQYYEVGFPE